MATDTEIFNRIYGNRQNYVELNPEPDDDEAILRRILEQNAVMLSNAPVKEPTALERIFVQPGQRTAERLQAMGGRIQESAQSMGQLPSMEAPLDYGRGTDIPSVLLQTIGSPVSLAFDVIGNTVVIGAEKAFGLLPESTREGALEFLSQTLQTEAGQKAMAALSEGTEAWDDYSRMYPNDAANWKSFFDIQLGLPKNIFKDFSPELRPIKLTTIGTRKVTQPLAGIDKDIYNIAYSGTDKTLEQAKLTTDPRGLLRTQEQLANPEQLLVIDELKRAGVSGNKTLQQNLNKVQEYLINLDKAILGLAKRKKNQIIDPDRFKVFLDEEFKTILSQSPQLFKSKAARQKLNQNYQLFLSLLQKHGNTAEGFLTARRAFDNQMKRSGVDVGSDTLSADVVSAQIVRRAGNKSLFELVPEAEDILARESRILSVQETMAKKAAKEAQTAVGRYIQELGLDNLVGESFASKVLNLGYAIGSGILASPYHIIKKMLKTETPANIRAKVSYAINDIFKEIEKGLARTKDPVTKKSLLAQRAIVYSAFREAGEQIIAEAEEKQEENE